MVIIGMTEKPQINPNNYDVNLHLQYNVSKDGHTKGGSLRLSAARKLSSSNIHRLSDPTHKTLPHNLRNKKVLRNSRTYSCIIPPPHISVSATQPDTKSTAPMLQGVLRKQERGILKRCKKRWFILSEVDNLIRYYSSTQSGSVLGEINLCNVIDVRQLKEDKGPKESPYGFQITTPDRAYYLYAETPAERQYWCDGLNTQLEAIRKATKLSVQTLSLTSPSKHNPVVNPSPLPTNTSTPNSNSPVVTPSATPSTSRKALTRSQSFTQPSVEVGNKVIAVHTGNGTMIVSTDDDAIRIHAPNKENATFSKIRKTDSFASTPDTPSPSSSINLVCTPNSNAINLVCTAPTTHPRSRTIGGPNGTQTSHHRHKKSNGRLQDDINEYVKISMWLQHQERERLVQEAEKLKEEQKSTLQQLEEEKKKVEALTALHKQSTGDSDCLENKP